jgi:hypothetical protein
LAYALAIIVTEQIYLLHVSRKARPIGLTLATA